MKTILTSLLLASVSLSVAAARFQDSVHSISKGNYGEDHLVYLNSGRVLFINQEDPLPEIGSRIEVDLDEEANTVRSISSLPDEPLPYEELPTDEAPKHEATVLSSYSSARTIFNGMNRSYKRDTECTDRAHIWTYEEWKKRGLISRKVFLFFTNTYIRRYNYKWWFHVSPYNLVRNGSGVTEYVMDRKYSGSPLTMRTWTNIFIKSRRYCPVSTYRYYRSNRNGAEHCYAVKSNMYNRLPLHVRNEEDSGRVQTQFNTGEVNFSYRAFTRRGARK